MNKAKFWKIIGESIKKHPGSDSDAVYRREKFLIDRLQLETLNNVVVFEKIWRVYEKALNQDRIYKVACKIDSFGGLSDDSWRDARQFIICQGQEAVESILRDPKAFYQVAGVKSGERTRIVTEIYVTMNALDKKTGDEFRDPRNDPMRNQQYNLEADRLE